MATASPAFSTVSSKPLLRQSPAHATRKMAGCVDALRCLVFIFNFIFWIAGLIILGLGLWLLFDPTTSDFFSLNSAHSGSFHLAAWLLVAAGLLMVLTGCCGCCGAWKLSQCALTAFFFVLIVAFCLELAAAVIAYNKQENIRGYIESSMYDTIRNKYASDSAYKGAFDSIQKEFECCGVKSYTDWLGASWDRKQATTSEEEFTGRIEHGIGAVGGGRGNGFGRVPSSCCNELGTVQYPTNCGVSFNQAPLHTYANFINSKGCADALYDSVYNHLDIAIAVCVIIGALQLIGMFLSMALCCCLGAEEKKYNNY